jgi:hypothetical protein
MEPDYDEAENEIEAIAEDAIVKKSPIPVEAINIALPSWAIDNVLEAAGRSLANDAKKAVAEIVAKRVADICNEAFVAEVTRRAHESAVSYLDKPRTRTNEWGESLGGAAVTWSEAIPKSVEAYLNASVDKQGNTTSYNGDKKGTRLSWLLQTQVTDQLKTETEKAAKAVTEQARAIVSQHVGRFISEQMIPAIDVQRINVN